MTTRSSELEQYATALALERAAWDDVRGRLPGSSSFDAQRWQRWRAAVEAADQAAAKARTTIEVAAPRRHIPFFRKTWPQAVRLPPILGGAKRTG